MLVPKQHWPPLTAIVWMQNHFSKSQSTVLVTNLWHAKEDIQENEVVTKMTKLESTPGADKERENQKHQSHSINPTAFYKLLLGKYNFGFPHMSKSTIPLCRSWVKPLQVCKPTFNQLRRTVVSPPSQWSNPASNNSLASAILLHSHRELLHCQ